MIDVVNNDHLIDEPLHKYLWGIASHGDQIDAIAIALLVRQIVA